MRQRELSPGSVLGLLGLAFATSFASGPGSRDARADERTKAPAAVQVPAQGGGGLEPVAGAPPPIAPSLDTRAVAATLAPDPSLPRASRSSLRALASAEGEATVEIDGARETVRAGSRLGRDKVKAVGRGRLVLERAATTAEPAALVIVTFDEAGRAKERVFWRSDPTAPVAPEVKHP
jgi:hypothetical protein